MWFLKFSFESIVLPSSVTDEADFNISYIRLVNMLFKFIPQE